MTLRNIKNIEIEYVDGSGLLTKKLYHSPARALTFMINLYELNNGVVKDIKRWTEPDMQSCNVYQYSQDNLDYSRYINDNGIIKIARLNVLFAKNIVEFQIYKGMYSDILESVKGTPENKIILSDSIMKDLSMLLLGHQTPHKSAVIECVRQCTNIDFYVPWKVGDEVELDWWLIEYPEDETFSQALRPLNRGKFIIASINKEDLTVTLENAPNVHLPIAFIFTKGI